MHNGYATLNSRMHTKQIQLQANDHMKLNLDSIVFIWQIKLNFF